MVNKPLIRPYFWGGYVRGGRLTSHYCLAKSWRKIALLKKTNGKKIDLVKWQQQPCISRIDCEGFVGLIANLEVNFEGWYHSNPRFVSILPKNT